MLSPRVGMPRERRWCRNSGSCKSLLEDKSKSRESIMKERKDSENGLVSDSPVWTTGCPWWKVCLWIVSLHMGMGESFRGKELS